MASRTEETIVSESVVLSRRRVLRQAALGGAGVAGLSVLSDAPANAVVAVQEASVLGMGIHGKSMQVNFPELMRQPLQLNTYAAVVRQDGGFNTFDFSIPTPVIVNERRLRLRRVIFNFRTSGPNAAVRNVWVSDGPTRILAADSLALQGDQSFASFDVPGQPQVFWALDLGVNVEFAKDGVVEFFAAFADFI